MKTDLQMDFSVDRENNKIHVKRAFAAPLSSVWAAWTQHEILDQWWAPQPWKARTKEMDFREGGHWLYAMVGPAGEEHWSRADYSAIRPEQGYAASDAFTDPEGRVNDSLPRSKWDVNFSGDGNQTIVDIKISTASKEDLDWYLKSGFQEGFTKGLENLDGFLAR